ELELGGVNGTQAHFLFDDVRDVFRRANQAGPTTGERLTDLRGVAGLRSIRLLLVHEDWYIRKPFASLGQHQKTCTSGGTVIEVTAQAHGNPQFVGREDAQFSHQLLGKQGDLSRIRAPIPEILRNLVESLDVGGRPALGGPDSEQSVTPIQATVRRP